MKPGAFILLGGHEFRLYWGRYPVGRIWSRRRMRTWFAETFDGSALDGTDRRWRGIYGTRAEAQAGLEALIIAADAGGSAKLSALAPIADDAAFLLIAETIRKAGPPRCRGEGWPKRCMFPTWCRCLTQAEAVQQFMEGRPGG